MQTNLSPLLLSEQNNSNILLRDEEEEAENPAELLHSRSTMLIKCKDTIIDLSQQLESSKKTADETSNKCVTLEEQLKTMEYNQKNKDKKIQNLISQINQLKEENALSARYSEEENKFKMQASESIDQLKSAYIASQTKNTSLEDQVTELTENLGAEIEKASTLQNAVNQYQNTVELYEKKMLKLQEYSEIHQSENHTLRESIDKAALSNKKLEKANKEHIKQLDKLKQEKEAQDTKMIDINKDCINQIADIQAQCQKSIEELSAEYNGQVLQYKQVNDGLKKSLSKYENYSTRISDIESAFVDKENQYKAELKKAHKSISEHVAMMNEFKKATTELETRIHKCKLESQSDSKALKEEIAKKNSEIKQKNEEIKKLNQDINQLNTNTTTSSREVNKKNEEINRISTELYKKIEDIRRKSDELSKTKEELRKKTEDYNRKCDETNTFKANLEEIIQKCKGEYQHDKHLLQEEITSKIQEIAACKADYENKLKLASEESHAKITKLNEEIGAKTDAINTLTTNIESKSYQSKLSATNEINNLKDDAAKKAEEIIALKREKEANGNKIKKLEADIERLNNTIIEMGGIVNEHKIQGIETEKKYESQSSELQAELRSANLQIKSLQQEKDNLQRELQKVKDYYHSSVNMHRSNEKQLKKKALNATYEMESDMQIMSSKEKLYVEEIQSLKQLIELQKKELEIRDDKIAESSKKMSDLQRDIEEYRSECDGYKRIYDEAHGECAKTQYNTNTLKVSNMKVLSRMEKLLFGISTELESPAFRELKSRISSEVKKINQEIDQLVKSNSSI